jgi:hypothetical protein
MDGTGGGTQITLEAPARLDRDLVVEWLAVGGLAADDSIGVRLVEGRARRRRRRYSLLTITRRRATGAFALQSDHPPDASAQSGADRRHKAVTIACSETRAAIVSAHRLHSRGPPLVRALSQRQRRCGRKEETRRPRGGWSDRMADAITQALVRSMPMPSARSSS